MLFILLVLFFVLADANSDEQSQDEYILPPRMERLFIDIHKPYNPLLRWDGGLAAEALEEATSPFTAKGISLRIRAGREFTDKENRTLKLRTKVTVTLEPYLLENAQELQDLPAGTLYGCDGVYYYLWRLFMRIVCLYQEIK